MSENRDQIPLPPPSIIFIINQQSTNIENDHYHNYSLCEGDHDHLSESSSTTNQASQQNNNNNIRSTRS
ncbi:unnamed protein product [Rotaria sp. Silwood2]|nr:unnamed protein product [Rotaria sp. Silwood2]CAF3496571.1 unnamed protein product [Rotaria sp. Silwood2]CAF4178635.1 unnamed protein product [Rotaria sp. Silwood2]CAF4324276.1 unnamed protein product [Rotaria sp. Silwood2]CAF4705781.1 unnamed protein product [Rotaria sp. Silwood2]